MLRLVLITISGLCLLLRPGVATADTLERIQQTGALKIGYRSDSPPFSFSISGEDPAGYSIGLCNAVAGALQRQLRLDTIRVDYVAVTADDRFQAVARGDVDLLCGATTATLARREIVDFSLPTFIDGASVLLRRGGPRSFAELQGKRVGVRHGTTTEDALRNTIESESMTVDTVAVTDHREGLAKLMNGEIEGYFADRAILYYLMAGSGVAERLYLSDKYLTYEPYALALRRGDSDFRLAVDRALSRLYRSGAIATVFAKTFGDNATPTGDLLALFRTSALPE